MASNPIIPGATEWLKTLTSPVSMEQRRRKAPPFNEIAKSLDPMMSQKDYDSIREQYFWDIVHPSMPRNILRGQLWEEFKKQTERPSLLTWDEKANAMLGIAGASFVKSAAPLPGFKELFTREQEELTRLAQREGLPVAPEALLGELTGMVLPLGTLMKVGSALTKGLLLNAKLSERALKLSQRIGRGSFSFGVYDVMREEEGEYLTAGAKGMVIGAVFELLLGTRAFLKARGVREPEKVLQDIMEGKPVDPAIDAQVAEKLVTESTARKSDPWTFKMRLDLRWSHGAAQYMRSPEGKVERIAIEEGREAGAVARVKQLLSEDWEQGELVYAGGAQSSRLAREFLRLAKGDADALTAPSGYDVVSTAPGMEKTVAGNMQGRVIGPGKVAVPKLDTDLGPAPTTQQIEAAVSVVSDETNWIVRTVNEIWNENVPSTVKGKLLEQLRGGPQGGGLWDKRLELYLPEKYRRAVGGTDLELVTKIAEREGRLSPELIRRELGGFRGTPSELERIDTLMNTARQEGVINELDEFVGRPKAAEPPAPTSFVGETIWVDRRPVDPQLTKSGVLTEPAYKRWLELGYTRERQVSTTPEEVERILTEGIKAGPPEPAKFTLASLMDFVEERGFDPGWVTKSHVELLNEMANDPYTFLRRAIAFAPPGKAPLDPKEITFDKFVAGMYRAFQEEMKKGRHIKWLETIMADPEREVRSLEVVIPQSEKRAVEQVQFFAERPRAIRGVVPKETIGGRSGMVVTPESKPPHIAIAAEVMKDPQLRRQVVYHENMHVDLHESYDYFLEPSGTASIYEAGKHVAEGLKRSFSNIYGKISEPALMEEAFTHIAAALRTGNLDALNMYARWDVDLPHILQYVNQTSWGLRGFLRTLPEDSIYGRSLERKLNDLVRRTEDKGLIDRLAEHIDEFGVPDIVDGKVVFYREGSEHLIGDLRKAHDYIDAMDLSTHAPNFTEAIERAGIRGAPFIDLRLRGPGLPERMPLPEVTMKEAALGFLRVGHLYRPFLNWVADAQGVINRFMAGKGQPTIPLYEAVKTVDRGVLEMDRAGDRVIQKLWDTLHGVSPERAKDFTMYISKSGEEQAKAAAALKMTIEEVTKAKMLEKLITEDLEQLLPGTTKYFKTQLPLMRKFEYSPEIIWGKAKTPREAQSADFFERAIRYDQTLPASEEHVGKLLAFFTKEGLHHRYVEGPITQLKELAKQKNEAGDFLLGSLKRPVDNYIRYLEGRPDVSQSLMNDFARNVAIEYNAVAKKLNSYLPKGAQLKVVKQEELMPRRVINSLLLLQYAGGLSLRPIVYVRDALQSFTALPIVGIEAFTKGVEKALTREAWLRSEASGALLGRMNVGQLWGDLIHEMNPGAGKMPFDKALHLASKLLQANRVSNNIGRHVAYTVEYERALVALEKYRRGQFTVADLMKRDNTSLWSYEEAVQSRLLKIADPRTLKTELPRISTTPVTEYRDPSGRLRKGGAVVVETPVARPYTNEEAAREWALELVDHTQWPYRRGAQPGLLTTGAGRVFGLYGQWPLNYLEYFKRMSGKLFHQSDQVKGDAIQAMATWVAYNGAIMQGSKVMGADMDKWFLFSSMGYGGSPNLDFALNLLKAPEDTPEGRKARRDVLLYPVNFTPGNVAVRQWLRVMEEDPEEVLKPGSESFWRLMGARPYNELEEDKDLQEWLQQEAGFGYEPVYY